MLASVYNFGLRYKDSGVKVTQKQTSECGNYACFALDDGTFWIRNRHNEKQVERWINPDSREINRLLLTA